MEPISQRLYDYFFKHKGYKNDTLISKDLGYGHPEKISRLFREGKTAKPSVDILEDITNRFGSELNIEWVLTGLGKMIKEKPGPSQAPDLLTLVKNEVEAMQLSLDKLSKAAATTLGSLPMPNAPVQDLQLGKNRDRKDQLKKNEPKDSVSKKGS